MMLKERASGMYRLSAFYFARTASDLPLDFAVPTIFLLLIYFMAHLRYTPQAFFANYFTVLLMGMVRTRHRTILILQFILYGAHTQIHAPGLLRQLLHRAAHGHGAHATPPCSGTPRP